MDKFQDEFSQILRETMSTYYKQMDIFMLSKKDIQSDDMIVMIMNLLNSVSTNIYYSIKQIFPKTVIDFDFIKVTTINNMSDSFEKVKQFEPLSMDNIKEFNYGK